MDVLTRMLEAKGMEQKTYDGIQTYLTALKATPKQNTGAAQQSMESEHAALVKVYSLVKAGKMEQSVYKTLIETAKQAQTSANAVDAC